MEIHHPIASFADAKLLLAKDSDSTGK